MPNRSVQHTILTVLLLAAACGKGRERKLPEGGAQVSPPILKPAFVLADQNGKPFDLRRDTEGYVTLLFFGYTHCPDVCPVHMSNIASALKLMSGEDQRRFKVVFVTTDPARDDAERLKAWLGALDPSFIGLRGPIDRINAITRGLGFGGASIEDTTKQDYTVGHLGVVFAFTRDNLAHTVYPFGVRQAEWATDLPRMIDAYAPPR